ncbi:MAG TPA: hypothetical protein GX717_06835 [Clostridiaceae bacterium]|nr:hypothetical protein [Clostridiaceae bacterium]
MSSEFTKDDDEHLYTAYFHIRSQASRLSDQEPPDEILERFSFVRSVLTK